MPIKRALIIIGQTFLLLLTAVAGMLFHPFHLVHVLSQQGYMRRQYEFDWLLSVGLAYVLLLVVGIVAGRIRTSWVGSTVAFVLTLAIIVVFTRIGYRDVNLLYGGR